MCEVDVTKQAFKNFCDCIIKGASVQDIYADSQHGYSNHGASILSEERKQARKELALGEFKRMFKHMNDLVVYVEKIVPLRGQLILDFGCGTGALSVPLLQKGARVTSVDPSPLNLRALEFRAEYFGCRTSNLQTIRVDSNPPLPFKENLFDIIICNSVMEFIPFSRREYILNFSSILKPEGILIIATENGFFPIDCYTKKLFTLFRRNEMVKKNVPYGMTYFELLKWMEQSDYKMENLSVNGYFNSLDKLIDRKMKKRKGISKKPSLLIALIRFVNYLLKSSCRALRIPSDLFFPYATYIFKKKGKKQKKRPDKINALSTKDPTKKEVSFVVQYFHPEVASTGQLMTELAEGLVKKGLNVKALVGQPTYVRSEKLPKKEVYNGIDIERIPCTRLDKNKSIGRMLNWVSFTVFAFMRLLFSKDRSVLVLVSQPPFLYVVGYLLNLIRGQKYVCLIYDLYPEIAEKLGYIKEGTLIARIWDRCNRAFFKRADSVIVPSENMKALIDKKIPDEADKVKILYNWADGEFIRPIDKRDNWFAKKYDLVDKLVVLYAGNIGLFHQLETLIEAADRLREKNNIQFVFIGTGGKKAKLMYMAKERALDNVLFLPYQDKKILPYSLTCSDISVVSLEKGLDCVAAPCKLYSSMAAGQVILGLVDENSDVAKIVNRYECGFCAEQDNVRRVVEVLNMLASDQQLAVSLGINARKCFEDNFQKEKAISKYYDILTVSQEGGKNGKEQKVKSACNRRRRLYRQPLSKTA